MSPTPKREGGMRIKIIFLAWLLLGVLSPPATPDGLSVQDAKSILTAGEAAATGMAGKIFGLPAR